MPEVGSTEPGPILGGIGIICRADRFLIRVRPEGTVYAGYWEFPGGKCEAGETLEQTTARECLEETGLQVAVGALRRVIEHAYPHGLVKLYFFNCTPIDPTTEPPPEHQCRWVKAEELRAYRFPEANEGIIDELEREARV